MSWGVFVRFFTILLVSWGLFLLKRLKFMKMKNYKKALLILLLPLMPFITNATCSSVRSP